MIAPVVALAALCLALLLLLRDQQKRHQEATETREKAWTEERRELLTRIQRPDLLPTPRPGKTPTPRQTDHQALAQVGTLTDLEATDGDNGSR